MLSLYGRGTPQNLIKATQDYRIDLLPVQEERWLGRSIIEKGCRIHYSCDEEQNIFGAVFIVRKLIRSRVINFKLYLVSSKISFGLRLRYDFTLILIAEVIGLFSFALSSFVDSCEIYFEHCVAYSVVFYETSTCLFLLRKI